MTDIMGQGTPDGQGSSPPREYPARDRAAGAPGSPARVPPIGGDDSTAAPSAAEVRDAEQFARAILPSASRTFAISIRMLPGTLGRAVLTSYLICRIADTIEDERTLSPTDKVELLDALLGCFAGAEAAGRFVDALPRLTGDPEHARLVRETGRIFVLFRSLPHRTRAHVRRWVAEMVVGMQRIVLRHPEGIRIQTLEEFREYCYYVAGTVGYLLTDLWHEHSGGIDARRYESLRARAQAFGQALQTVNILKDVARDAADENSVYIPEEALRRYGSAQAHILSPDFVRQNHAAVKEMIELAWRDLDEARSYLLELPRRAVPIRLFCVFPLLFAHATLRELTRSTAMLAPGGSPRITRREVRKLLAGGTLLILSNRGLRWLAERAGGTAAGSYRPSALAAGGSTE